MSGVPQTPAEYRAAERERKQREAFMQSATKFVVSLAFLPLEAWVVMLALGALHGAVAAVPAIGYGAALLILLGINILAGKVRK
ncbi:hypothetical protein [Streptomyces sp. DH12]|uniref:hypothetical protein n=1 Tax=Streptomyces sp. DH12 TaxID=2857010 RepID=UPI001E48D95C|nr:hypothetical protein [Streptomyces sp. DH12]